MKITESQLRRIIREELLVEITDPMEDPELACGTAEMIGQSTPGLVRGPADAVRQLFLYDRMKRESGMPDSDTYYHFIAFCHATKILLAAGFPRFATKIALIALGEGKEAVDFINIFGSTPLNIGEWGADMKTNKAGIAAGLNSDECCGPALRYAQQYLPTVGELRSRSAKWAKMMDGSGSGEYGWAQATYPSLYSDSSIFIQPRYHCALTPAQRHDAWRRAGVTPIAGVTGPLRWQ